MFGAKPNRLGVTAGRTFRDVDHYCMLYHDADDTFGHKYEFKVLGSGST